MPDMRFAPPNPLRIADRATGLNAVSIRSYNERLVLSLLQQKDAVTRLEIGERTGLSAQTISVLVRSLEHEGLVTKGEAQKGRVGPPTVPIALNPEGAFSIGVSVGPKRTEVVLIDFTGGTRFSASLPNPEHHRDSNHSEFLDTIRQAMAIVPPGAKPRLVGVGLALPHDKAAGQAEVHYLQALQSEIEQQLEIPVFVQNDVAAAVSGESMFGVAKPLSDYMYFYLGARLHGRLILNHQIYNGNSPVSFDVGLEALERSLGEAGQGTAVLWEHDGWPDLGEHLVAWEHQVANQIGDSVAAIAQFAELEAVVISSPVPEYIRRSICTKLELRQQFVPVVSGLVHPSPEAVGAASLAFGSIFTLA